ncbi:MAG: hypothetical protein PHD46_06880 [Eubacteriales bacterium]|nr:hypothetical protein [Eubacteriales bacterium]
MNEKKRQDDSKRKRRNSIIIRLSDEELVELNEAIEKSGLTRADFIMKVLHGSNITVIPDLQNVYVELKRQGINLNQALRFTYQTGFTYELENVIKRCNAVIDIAKDLLIATENKAKKGGKK